MMKRLNHLFSWAAVGLLIVLSAVPLRVLLLFSPVLSFFVGQVFGYRRAVITTNLRRSFPEKEDREIRRLRSAFYLHVADVFFETVSLFLAPRAAIRRRYVADAEGEALLASFARQGTTVVCLAAHLGNWETHLPAFMDFTMSRALAVYRPLADRPFDWFLARIRRRFCAGIIPDRQVARTLVRMKNDPVPAAIGLVSDQSPGNQDLIWLDFMHQDTAFYAGPEKLIRMFRLPALFMYSRKVSRGRYKVHIDLIAANPADLPEGEITRRYVALIEREIHRSPVHYLWSHRRWKKRRA